jgi:hypothetical protein
MKKAFPVSGGLFFKNEVEESLPSRPEHKKNRKKWYQ